MSYTIINKYNGFLALVLFFQGVKTRIGKSNPTRKRDYDPSALHHLSEYLNYSQYASG